MKTLILVIVLLWLAIGVAAAWQRGYFGDDQDLTCKTGGDTALTIVAGPLNYVGANPKVDCDVQVPQPSN